MTATFTIKQNNTRSALKATLTESSGTAANLTNATVNFIMSTFSLSVVINKAATIVDPINGVVQYVFTSSDTANPGQYKGEFKVTFSDGSVETFPNNDFINIVIESSLA